MPCSYLLYGDVSAKAAAELRRPEVANHFARLIQRASVAGGRAGGRQGNWQKKSVYYMVAVACVSCVILLSREL